jgi:hypothetical protein
MQEVSGSIPLGSTIFRDEATIRGMVAPKNPKLKAREAAWSHAKYPPRCD